MIDTILSVVVTAVVACGLTEFVKRFLPEVLKTGWKITLVSGLIAAGCGLVTVVVFGLGWPFPSVTVIAGTVAVSTLLYEVVVKLAKKIEDFLKSKITK